MTLNEARFVCDEVKRQFPQHSVVILRGKSVDGWKVSLARRLGTGREIILESRQAYESFLRLPQEKGLAR